MAEQSIQQALSWGRVGRRASPRREGILWESLGVFQPSKVARLEGMELMVQCCMFGKVAATAGRLVFGMLRIAHMSCPHPVHL